MPWFGEKKRQYNREYYLRNKAAEIIRSMAKRRSNIDRVKEYLTGYLACHPCVDCGEIDPVVLEFDHRNPLEKRFSMADARRGKFSLTSVKTEVEKCDVRCANCHRRQTAKQVREGVFRPGYPVRAVN